MKLFNKLYVGIQGGAALSMVDFPLGFAIPMGDTAAFRKQKETVDNWVGGYGTYQPNPNGGNAIYVPAVKTPGTVLDNLPREGFSFEKSVSRWSTSNKWFRINDPLGFTLEISADNLADIILNTTIVDGVIQEKLFWTRFGSGNFLTRLDHPEYIKQITPMAKGKPEVGDLVENTTNGEMIYLGSCHVITWKQVSYYWNEITKAYDIENYNKLPGGYYGLRNAPNGVHHQTRMIETRDEKPWKVFEGQHQYGNKTKYVVLRRDFGNLTILEKGKQPDAKLPEKDKIHKVNFREVFEVFSNKKEIQNAPLRVVTGDDLKD